MSWWSCTALRSRGALVALVGSVVLAAAAAPTAGASLAGVAGTDTSLPATPSQVTVSGRGEFSGLKITVNQTKNLVNQAVSITWTGGKPTISAPARFGGDYLQIMQCWGDDDGSVPGNPGPPPEQCVQGATAAVYGGTGDTSFPSISLAASRIISKRGWPDFDPSLGALDDASGNLWMPFRSVTGTTVGVGEDSSFDPQVVGGNFWLNSFFNIITTNEIAGARTAPNGSGAELFEVNTGEESSGLGCGLKVQPVLGGAAKVPQCWIVLVPRGTPAEENVGTAFADTPAQPQAAEQTGVVTSPLAPGAWKNRIAIPIDFNPLDSPCQLSADQRQVSGDELPALAVSSWQPTLCTMPGRPPYAYSVVSDATARTQVQNNTPGSPGMIIVNQPFDPSVFPASDPVVYAPITLSATVIGFNVERTPKVDADAASKALQGVRVADINLTPRLLAKLLTQSYAQQVEVENHSPGYPWLKTNPFDMAEDPDFLQFNPEFSTLQIGQTRNFGGLVLPLGNSDQARQVWQYVLADPEAKAWLDGAPDPWGMKVNPVYATKAAANGTGTAFGDPLPTSFPKSDPYCYQAPNRGPGGSILPPSICGNVWLPYSLSLHGAAQDTRAANDGARIVDNPFATTSDDVWQATTPQIAGARAILSLTDSADAALFGIQTASLSRAGDDGANRAFVAPDSAGVSAGMAAMKPSAVPSVLQPDPAVSAPKAYPLTTVTYAAVAPLQLDSTARADYAAFVTYAAGPGQVPGPQLGQLPVGYTPLPDALKAQAAAAAKTILNPPSGPPTTVAASSPRPTVAASPATAYLPTAGSEAPPSPSTAASTVQPSAPSTTRAPATTLPVQTLTTPATVVSRTRFLVPGLLCVSLLSALGALEITKRPRIALRNREGRARLPAVDRMTTTHPREGARS